MSSTITFKFDRGDRVVAPNKTSGIVFQRIDTDLGNLYAVRFDDGIKFDVPEKTLRLVRYKPKWLRKGVKIQWMGEGRHDVYVVDWINRKTPPYVKGHDLSYKDIEMGFTCTEANMKQWRRVAKGK